MHITLSPMRSDDTLTVIKAGDTLTINGAAFDFSSLPDGATIPMGEIPCEWIFGAVERVSGRLHFTLILPHGANPSEAVAFPTALDNPPDGTLSLPFDPPPVEQLIEEEPADVDA